RQVGQNDTVIVVAAGGTGGAGVDDAEEAVGAGALVYVEDGDDAARRVLFVFGGHVGRDVEAAPVEVQPLVAGDAEQIFAGGPRVYGFVGRGGGDGVYREHDDLREDAVFLQDVGKALGRSERQIERRAGPLPAAPVTHQDQAAAIVVNAIAAEKGAAGSIPFPSPEDVEIVAVAAGLQGGGRAKAFDARRRYLVEGGDIHDTQAVGAIGNKEVAPVGGDAEDGGAAFGRTLIRAAGQVGAQVDLAPVGRASRRRVGFV